MSDPSLHDRKMANECCKDNEWMIQQTMGSFRSQGGWAVKDTLTLNFVISARSEMTVEKRWLNEWKRTGADTILGTQKSFLLSLPHPPFCTK